MSSGNVEIVRRCYESLNRRDWDAVFRDADPEVTFTTQSGPEAGTRRGREAVVNFIEDLGSAFDSLVWEPEEIYEREDCVVVLVCVRSRPRASVTDLIVHNGHLWKIEDRVVRSFESFPEPLSALKAAGLSD